MVLRVCGTTVELLVQLQEFLHVPSMQLGFLIGSVPVHLSIAIYSTTEGTRMHNMVIKLTSTDVNDEMMKTTAPPMPLSPLAMENTISLSFSSEIIPKYTAYEKEQKIK